MFNEDDFPLNYVADPDGDIPAGITSQKALDYNVLRTLMNQNTNVLEGAISDARAEFAQYVSVPDFPDGPAKALTLEVWVKIDYIEEIGPFPNCEFGFGACPQPMCKAKSWYLFAGTLQTDRNLIFSIDPGDTIQDGLPPGADPTANPPKDGGGLVSEDKIAGGVWTHLAATLGPCEQDCEFGANIMKVYINGVSSYIENVPYLGDNDFGDGESCAVDENGILITNGTVFLPQTTNMDIADIDPELRLGMFRDDVKTTLDYQYSGLLAGVRIYHRTLSDAEILADYHHDLGIQP